MSRTVALDKLKNAAPWLLLALFLVWGWHKQSLTRSLPVYGDALELTWALTWYDEALRSGQNVALFPGAFYPTGWYLATFGAGPALLFVLLPLYWLGGAAFAYNSAVLLTFVLTYAGAWKLGRLFLQHLGALAFACLLTFWGFRWFQALGHLNILLGTAVLPWMLWLLETVLSASPRRWRAKLVLVGVLWALAAAGSLYFTWLHGLALLLWITGRWLARRSTTRTALAALAIPALVMGLLSAPVALWTLRAAGQVGSGFFMLGEVNAWGASLNALPLPSVDHPWLGTFSRQVYRGLGAEQDRVNLGLLASVLAVAGAWAARRTSRQWLPVWLLAAGGLVFALGLTLKWDNETLSAPALQPINRALWQIGHSLKPALFPTAHPLAPFDQGITLPAFWLTVAIPWLERARVFARYALEGAVGVFLLTGLGVQVVRYRWLRVALFSLLMFELLPAPLARLPFPMPPHPAFVWLADQRAATGDIAASVIDLSAARAHTPMFRNGGETIWPTRLHHWPIVSGASSVWPAAASDLQFWLTTHDYALASPQLTALLRFPFHVQYILLHMQGEQEQELLADAQSNPQLRLVNCFEPVAGNAWPEPICVLELLPPPATTINLALEEGWSGEEPWGAWMQGTTARAFWLGTANSGRRLALAAFPQCVADNQQAVTVEVNGEVVAEHRWADCEPWTAQIELPATLVRLGRNEVTLRAAYAVSPGSNDPRPLSVGWSQLMIEAP